MRNWKGQNVHQREYKIRQSKRSDSRFIEYMYWDRIGGIAILACDSTELVQPQSSVPYQCFI